VAVDEKLFAHKNPIEYSSLDEKIPSQQDHVKALQQSLLISMMDLLCMIMLVN
jgi:hypothetical protein